MASTGRKSNIGTAYVPIVPDFGGFFIAVDREMTRKLPAIMEKVFKDTGKDLGKNVGLDFVSSFENTIDSRMRAAINAAANVTVTVPAPIITEPLMPSMPTIPAPQIPQPVIPEPAQIPQPNIPAPVIPDPSNTQQVGQDVGNSLGEAIQGALAGAAALALGDKVLGSFTTGADMEAGGDKLQAQLNLNTEQAAKLAAVSESLFTDAYGPDRDTINANLKSIVGSIKGARDMSAEELGKMGKDAANLSGAFELEATAVSKAASSMTTNEIAKDWDSAVAVITAGYQDMGDRGDDWIDTLSEYSGDFAQFGLSAEQAFGAVNSMVNTGGFFNTDTAADAIRETGIQARSGENAEFLEAIGLDPAAVQKAANEGGDAWLKTFQEIMQALDKTGNKSLYGEIIGTQAEDQLNAIMNADWSKMTEPVGDLSNRMTDLDKVLNDNFKTSWTEFLNTMNSFFTELIMPAIEWLLPHLKELIKWLDQNKVAVAILATVIGVTMVASAIAATVAFWGMMAPFFPLIGTVLLVVAAVALLGLAFWAIAENWDAIAAWGVALWTGFATWWVGMWGGFGSMMNDFGNNTVGMFTDMGKHIGNFFINIANGFIQMWNGMLQALNSVQIHMPDWLGGGDWNGLNLSMAAEIPMMAEGGTVLPKAGGVPTIIGVSEAGKAESIVDAGLLNDQLAAATANLREGGSGGDTYTGDIYYTIHQQPNESTEELLERLEELKDLKGDFQK